MKGVAISEAHRNPAPEYAEDYVMEQFTIEEGGTSTPPFSPLLKRNIPLSIPGDDVPRPDGEKMTSVPCTCGAEFIVLTDDDSE
ncbi:hypothetical protein M758_3G080800 [Ceratodon purpureus]|nr:hypothetical protein M758_3G080800 [Ceratodon purpureus]